jgi:hypothetical protein
MVSADAVIGVVALLATYMVAVSDELESVGVAVLDDVEVAEEVALAMVVVCGMEVLTCVADVATEVVPLLRTDVVTFDDRVGVADGERLTSPWWNVWRFL